MNLDLNDQIRCHWQYLPENYDAQITLFGIGTDVAGNKDCVGSPPSGVYIEPEDILQKTQSDSPLVVSFDLDRDELNLSDTPGEVSVSLCTRIDLFEVVNDTRFSVAYHATFITVIFKLDGSFDVNGIGIGEDDDYFDPIILKKWYGVTSYQCELQPPHNRANITLTQKNDHLGICVETVEADTIISQVEIFQVDMPALSSSLPGYSPVSNPRIRNGIVFFLSTYDCTLKKNPDAPENTKCFIETIIESPFFDAWNYESNDYYIRALGLVDLIVGPSRKLQKAELREATPRALQGREGSIDVKANLAFSRIDYLISRASNVSLSVVCLLSLSISYLFI